MLTVTNFSNPVFTAKKQKPVSKNLNEDRIIRFDKMDQDTYDTIKSELEEQREELEELADNKEYKLPKPVNTALKGGAVVTTGLLGGMASGWGTKKSLAGLKKLVNTDAVKSVRVHAKETKKFVFDNAKLLKANFIKSKVYTMPANSIKKAYAKFSKTKIGEPLVKFFNKIGNGIKAGYTKVKNGIKHLWNKIRGVKNETWEKATVNTVGVSGGVASGVTALKEQDKKED